MIRDSLHADHQHGCVLRVDRLSLLVSNPLKTNPPGSNGPTAPLPLLFEWNLGIGSSLREYLLYDLE